MKKFDTIFFALFVLYLGAKRFLTSYISETYLALVFIILIVILIIVRIMKSKRKGI